MFKNGQLSLPKNTMGFERRPKKVRDGSLAISQVHPCTHAVDDTKEGSRAVFPTPLDQFQQTNPRMSAHVLVTPVDKRALGWLSADKTSPSKLALPP